MLHHVKRLGVVVVSSAALVGAGGAVGATAGAATASQDTLSGIQSAAAAAITLRVNDLNDAIARVNVAKSLGAGVPALLSYLGADITPLQALGHKIAGDTVVSSAKADYDSIFANFRVLALVLPASRLASASDEIDNSDLPHLTTASADAATHVDASNQAALQPLIDNLDNEISAATSDSAGIASHVLGDTPAQWNADTQLLSPSQSSLATAVSDVQQARSDLQHIRAFLKSSHHAATTPTTT